MECANGYDPAALRKSPSGVADMCREIEAQGKEANFSNVVIFMKEKFQHLNVGYMIRQRGPGRGGTAHVWRRSEPRDVERPACRYREMNS